jgi:hypothetical protein
VAEQFAEAEDKMRGLVVSTIYLRMGLKKSWILEYWIAAEEGSAAPKGMTAGLEAPWPYVMFRLDPALPPDADVVLVRGTVTAAGQLDRLSLLLPAEWSRKGSLFQALTQWRFRPASRDGHAQAVEVLLMIPRQPEE